MSEERDVSEFNGSQLKMFRIDEALRGISMCRHNLNLTDWLFYLQDFDMELESVKRKEEKIELEKELKILAIAINTFQNQKSNSRIKVRRIPPEVIDKLNTYQKKLLTIFKTSGLEMKLQGDAMSNFGR